MPPKGGIQTGQFTHFLAPVWLDCPVWILPFGRMTKW
jgi:hypothetical protein